MQEDLLRTESEYWFPAKHYGWGWGFPITWQGWLVLIAYILLVVIGVFLFPPRKSLAGAPHQIEAVRKSARAWEHRFPRWLVLEIDIGDLLAAVIAHDKGGGLFFNGPGWREAACGQWRYCSCFLRSSSSSFFKSVSN